MLNNIASRVINEVASNSTMPSGVKVIGTAAKVVNTGKALVEIQNVVSQVEDRLSANIANLDQKRPDIGSILEQKLHPVFNSTKARETVAILENQGFIHNGRFVKIDGIDEVDFGNYDHLKVYIVTPCKKLYEAQHQDYTHLKQKLKSDLSSYVVRSLLGSIRSEIMHPVLASPLAKLSHMVTEGLAKTFSEFTDGHRRRKIEAKIAANANRLAENRLIEVVNHGREQETLLNPKQQLTINTKKPLNLIEENYNTERHELISSNVQAEIKSAVPLSDETMNYLNNLFAATQPQSQTPWVEANTGVKQTPWHAEVTQTKLPQDAYNRIYQDQTTVSLNSYAKNDATYNKMQQRFAESAAGINVIESETYTEQDIKFGREHPKTAMIGHVFNILPLALPFVPATVTAVASLGETASILSTGVSTGVRGVFQPAMNSTANLFSSSATTTIPIWAGGVAGGSSVISATLPNSAPFINLLKGTTLFYGAKLTSDMIGDLRSYNSTTHNEPKPLPIYDAASSLRNSGYNLGMMGAGLLGQPDANITFPAPIPPMNIFSTPIIVMKIETVASHLLIQSLLMPAHALLPQFIK